MLNKFTLSDDIKKQSLGDQGKLVETNDKHTSELFKPN